MSFVAGLFYAAAAVALFSGLAVVFRRDSEIVAGLSLLATMVAVAVVFVLLEAHYIALVQLLIPAGAVVIGLVFTSMLVQREPDARLRRRNVLPFGAVIVGVLALGVGVHSRFSGGTAFPPAPEHFGAIRALGATLYTDYALIVGLLSLLLLAAIVGATVLSSPRRDRGDGHSRREGGAS